MFALASGAFWFNNTQRIRMAENKSILYRVILAFVLCGPIVWVIGIVGVMGKCIGWFIDRSTTWTRGRNFLKPEDKAKIEKIKALFNN